MGHQMGCLGLGRDRGGVLSEVQLGNVSFISSVLIIFKLDDYHERRVTIGNNC